MPKASSKSVTAAPKPQDEKITVNLGCVDLGQIDLLVQEGFYANRSDFIRTATRNQLAVHGDSVRQAAARKTLSLGVLHVTESELLALKAAGETLDIRVLGLATIDPSVTPDLALATISSLTVLGALHASAAVKAALRARIR
ncbi:CopG family transcriptional regulator [Ramlibacter ginsenosidimutans]|uniref:CopG family transcriptional regulator n=1 Tax=Ramlibacter ginsenosidimutans TaxID=502333 RepID=A0A934TTM4_9BURK|nr:CopG family transcriptional regulator [Ramlibacter ginsenosidimutans]